MENTLAIDFRKFIHDVPDFPKPGITFKDITPLLSDPRAFATSIETMSAVAPGFTKVIGIDSRGFIFGAAIALQAFTGFVPVRKKGKLPRETHSVEFDLEYGSATVELHRDALSKHDKVLIVDDVLATGGTLEATKYLVEQTGASIVGAIVLVELADLKGRDKLGDMPIFSLVCYD